MPIFPNEIDTFVDLFCGGGEVGLNVKCNALILNDYNTEFIKMFEFITQKNYEKDFDNIVEKYQLSKTNKEGYLQLRNDYNEHKDYLSLYMLLCHSFNNQISFNKSREFNVPFGTNRSNFNNSLRNKYIKYVEAIKNKKVIFRDKSFENLKIEKLNNNDMVYIDPPYLISVGGYERDYKLKWNEKLEISLLEKLDKLNSNGIKFALSNVLSHKNKTNEILIEWAKKYNIHHLNADYSNCNYQTKDKTTKSDEVLITNY